MGKATKMKIQASKEVSFNGSPKMLSVKGSPRVSPRADDMNKTANTQIDPMANTIGQNFQVPGSIKKGMNMTNFSPSAQSNKFETISRRIDKAHNQSIREVMMDPAMRQLSDTWMGAFYTQDARKLAKKKQADKKWLKREDSKQVMQTSSSKKLHPSESYQKLMRLKQKKQKLMKVEMQLAQRKSRIDMTTETDHLEKNDS